MAVMLVRPLPGRARAFLSGRGLSGSGNPFVDFWNPNIKTSDWFADAYYWLNYGTLPKLIEPSATDTPEDIARKNIEVIKAAERDGSWSAEPRLGFTAEDLANLPDKLKSQIDAYKWWLIGGAVAVVGVVALSKRRGR